MLSGQVSVRGVPPNILTEFGISKDVRRVDREGPLLFPMKEMKRDERAERDVTADSLQASWVL